MVFFDDWKTENKGITEEDLINRIKTNFTDADMVRHLGGGIGDNIIKYSDLEDFKTIEDLLPHDKSYKIILLEADDFNRGHWYGIMRYGDTIEFFNSYGKAPDSQKNTIDKCRNFILGQDKNYLSNLIKKRPKGMKYVYNKKPYQKLRDGVNTCGRWLVFRIKMMQELGMDMNEFKKTLELNVKKSGLPPDALVSIYIA